MRYIVTKIEQTAHGVMVTAKDADETKTKRRNHTQMVDDPRAYWVGQEVKFGMV